ncbi:MAG TPA: STAS domain-containing protein [Angustibacter sp.]|nr:STAS domain-containing protein [Angustibacter sp.]
MTYAQPVPAEPEAVDVPAPTAFEASARVTAGVAVITATGSLDGDAVPALRKAVRAALKVRTAHVVLDLNAAELCDESALILAWVRSVLARQGASLSLVTASHTSISWLHEFGHDAYRVLPTVPLAVGVAGGVSPRRQRLVPRQLVVR